VALAGLRALLERHVELFNEAVRTGDYAPYLRNFDENAVMKFDDFPIGPFRGKAEIIDAYETQPPSDTMALIDMQEIGSDSVEAAFEWDAGGTGRMFLRWSDDRVVELSITLTG
jgi:steroid Delta-isomerase